MDRSEWLKQTRQNTEALYDSSAPKYWDTYGLYPNESHQQFIKKFLALIPPRASVLDAACGAGRYEPYLVEAGHSVTGIDQSQGMLNRAREKIQGVQYEKIGLQEMDFDAQFDGIICMDAMEHVFPEDWPNILHNFYRALKPGGVLYFTLEVMAKEEVDKAYRRAQALGVPSVYGELVDEDVYHFYPSVGEVTAWTEATGFSMVEEGEGDLYHHFIARKPA